MFREDSYPVYWLSLPWRCKLGAHVPADRESTEDTGYSVVVVSVYSECERCGTFLGWKS